MRNTFLAMSVAAICGLSSVTCQATTIVGGPLSGNVKWTTKASPYLVNQNLEILQGSQLAIEPGVEVRLENYTFEVSGCLQARGTKTKPIVFTAATEKQRGSWGPLLFNDSAVDAVYGPAKEFKSGSILEHCRIEFGTGIVLDRSSPAIVNNLVQYHYREKDGAGIRVYKTRARIQNNVIQHCLAKYDGGGLAVLDSEGSEILGNTIQYNAATSGGGIAVNAGKHVIEGNDIRHNFAHYGGGVFARGGDSQTPSISGNVVSHNTATSSGGGIRGGEAITIQHNSIVNNRIVKSRIDSGTAISVDDADATIQYNWVAYNYATTDWGGAVSLSRSNSQVTGNFITQNGSTGLIFAGSYQGRHLTQRNVVSRHEHAVWYASDLSKRNENLQLKNNHLADNRSHVIVNKGPANVACSGNWFGTTDQNALNQLVLDYFDDRSKGRAIVHPAKTAPKTNETRSLGGIDIGSAAVKNVTANVSGSQITLRWDKPDRDDVAGYRVLLTKANRPENVVVMKVGRDVTTVNLNTGSHGQSNAYRPIWKAFGKQVSRTTEKYSVRVLAHTSDGFESAFHEPVEVAVRQAKGMVKR